MRNWHGNLSPFGKWHTAGSRVFSPAILFAGGEAGVWYDPSDLTTLFQDTAGTTPVTTAGQTVALMLDKSQGLTLGPELVTNGTFDTDSDWIKVTVGTGPAPTITGGVAVIPRTDASNYGHIHQTFSVVAGQSYIYEVTATSNQVQVRVGNSPLNSAADAINVNAGTTIRRRFTATVSAQVFTILNIADGTTASVDNVSVKELPGNHATQPTAAARPTYQTDGTLHWLSFDGVDDFMVTPTITPGIDKAQVFAGVRKLSDATSIIAELGNGLTANDGVFFFLAENLYGSTSRGDAEINASQRANTATVSGADTSVITATHDIAGDLTKIRRNAGAYSEATAEKGAGNFLAYPMYIGKRGGTSLPFTGNIYSLVTRFGANLETSTIETTETYVAGKTGVTL